MKNHDVGAVIIALFFIGSSVIHGFPPEGLTGKPHPFGDCMIYQLGNTMNPFTDFQELHDGSQLAFYPMTNEEVMLYLEIHISETVFRVTLEGTTFKLEKCSYSTRRCIVEDEGGVKHNDFIKVHEWNIVKVLINSQQLQIYVGSRMVKTMSMLDYPDKNKMTWLVRYKYDKNEEESSVKGSSKGGTKGGYKVNDVSYPYLVQFRCKEFVPHDNTPKWRTEAPTITSKYPDSHVGWPERNDYPIKPLPPKYPKQEDVNKHEYHFVTTDAYNEFVPINNSSKWVTVVPTSTFTYHRETTNSDFDWTGKSEYSQMSEGSYVGLIVGLVIGILIAIAIAIVIVVDYFVIKKRRSASMNVHSPLHDQKTQIM